MTRLFSGILKKMSFTYDNTKDIIYPKYYLQNDDGVVDVNSIIGKIISIQYLGKITCVSCGKTIKKSFGQGYCYPCFISVPQTEECVLRPELCKAHEGVARDKDYAKENCLVDQYVYLALSGGLKVGVTRYHQIPNRWIDQGAVKAIKVAVAENRYAAGLIEVALKKNFADKTNWRKMLMGNDYNRPLIDEKNKAIEIIREHGLNYSDAENSEFNIEYPLKNFPFKIVSKDLEKDPAISGLLLGVKGQYFILEGGLVINVRKHTGYHVTIDVH